MTARALVLVTLAALGACDGDPVAIITVTGRPAVHDLETLDVKVTHEGTVVDHTFELRGRDLPTTFSVTAPGREGPLQISARAYDRAGHLGAFGAAAATLRADQVTETNLLLEPADFVVNTGFANAQRLSFFARDGGQQIAVGSDGIFTIGFSDDCLSVMRCDVFGRRFDQTARPVRTELAASDAQFNLNRSNVFGNDPSMATGADGTTIAIWSTGQELLCTATSATGGALPDPFSTETLLGTSNDLGDPAIAALSPDRFVITWAQDASGVPVVAARVIDGACRPVASIAGGGSDAAFIVAQATASLDHPVVAGTALAMAFIWREGDALRGRFTGADGAFATPAPIDLVAEPGEQRWGQQVVATGEGYTLLYAFRKNPEDEVGLLLRRMDPVGAAIGEPASVGSGLPDENAAPSLARAGDGRLGVAWHVCGGLDADCGVVARVMGADGEPAGDAFLVNTTTDGAQVDPSIAALPEGFVVAFTDESQAPPDESSSSIRARVIYP